MARVGVSSGDFLSFASNPPAPCTFGGFYRWSGTGGNPPIPMRLGSAADFCRTELFDFGTGPPLASGVGSDAGTNDFAGSFFDSAPEWYFMGCRCPTAGAGRGFARSLGTLTSDFESLNAPNWNNLTATTGLGIGANPFDSFQYLDGWAKHCFVYTGLLDDEVMRRISYLGPAHLRTNLWGYWPLVANRFDFSGNGRHLTENGTITYSEHPPIKVSLYRGRQPTIVAAAAPASLLVPSFYGRPDFLVRSPDLQAA